MHENHKVWVYLYREWDEDSNSHKVSSRYATEEAIRNGLGTPVHSSGVLVEQEALKDRGIYISIDEESTTDAQDAE